jgi:DNA-binding response OmpR family regulator
MIDIKKILIIDDEVEITRIMERFLQKSGYSTIALNSGQEAINKISENLKFDLVIVDLGMPVVSGCIVVKEIRSKYKNLPIIILSGFLVLGDNCKEVMDYGVSESDILCKPVDLFELQEIIKHKLQ